MGQTGYDPEQCAFSKAVLLLLAPVYALLEELATSPAVPAVGSFSRVPISFSRLLASVQIFWDHRLLCNVLFRVAAPLPGVVVALDDAALLAVRPVCGHSHAFARLCVAAPSHPMKY